MIRVGTVFSGIGAIEHALERMGIKYKIMFACDNGDVDILSKRVKADVETIQLELKTLESLIDEIEDKENDFYKKEFLTIKATYNDKTKNLKDISDKISTLYEKINHFKISKHLDQIKDYKEKKEYVDSLYKEKEPQNKVKKSYMANYDIDDEHFHWNVSFLDGKQYEGKIDLFVGGSPCQSFSLAGKQRGLEDTRGTLFYEFGRLVKEIQPKVFIYENVKAVLINDGGRTWAKMKDVFDGLGYDIKFKIGDKPSVLNSKDYGIPQSRERMFVVGFRKDIVLAKPFEFPKPFKLEKKMQDFLLENTEEQIGTKLDKYFLSEKMQKYVLSGGTKNYYKKPEIDLEVARTLLKTMHKMHRAGIDNYVTTNGRLRKLTPRECLRLMGFCDDFKIVVSDTAMYQQAGNSIVVDVLIHIMNSILTSYPELIS